MVLRLATFTLAALIATACSTPKKPSSEAKTGADANESARPFLTGMRQFTFEGQRAGEGYFSADGRYMVFQSEREKDNPFYQIYVMDLKTGATNRVSPGKGKTTCAWIKPDNKKVLFASTHHDPKLAEKVAAEWEERRNPKSKYSWSFDEEYEIYEAGLDGKNPRNLTKAKGYDAEGSYSPDGKWIAFASNRGGYTENLSAEDAARFAKDPSYMMDLYIMKADGTQLKQLTTAKGYDGGPFFSPDGKRLVFRRFSPDGHSAEVFSIGVDGKDEIQMTKLKAMSWAPFYHPSGDYVIFATNKVGYQNFELYIVDALGRKDPVRVSWMDGFDGLPVFTRDGNELVWTHSNERGEAQLYRAAWNDALAREALGLAPRAPKIDQLSAKLTSEDARRWVEYLAHPYFEGRMTGSPKEAEYAQALADAFKAFGLKPGFGKDFIQTYEFTSGLELGPKNTLTLSLNGDTKPTTVGQDWIPLSYSQTGSFASASLVFAGYGIVATAASGQPAYDAFGSLDVKDKWVVVFSGLPEDVTQERRFHLHLYSRLQHKALVARQRGARGLIIVEDLRTPSPAMTVSFEGRSDDAGLPVLRLSPKLADALFSAAKTTRKGWTTKLAKGATDTFVFPEAVTAQAETDLQFKKSTARNILAVLPARAKTTNTVVIGAHLDHLGHGERGNSLSRKPGAAHLGADDNASGVAAVMEIAHLAATMVQDERFAPTQNLLFALWTGEEIGVIGSSHFMNTLNGIKPTAYVNLDMVGRYRDHVAIQGVNSAPEWRGFLEKFIARIPNLTVRLHGDPYLPTDALAFYMKEVPAISFFTGSHTEYHTPEDRPELLNYQGLTAVAHLSEAVVASLSSSPRSLVTYQKVEGDTKTSPGRGFRLYLGTIPDYSQDGTKGVLISGTSKGSPAEAAGLKAGDVIVELGGMKIHNIQDYVYCLQALKANEPTRLRVQRAGRTEDLEITPVLKTQQ